MAKYIWKQCVGVRPVSVSLDRDDESGMLQVALYLEAFDEDDTVLPIKAVKRVLTSLPWSDVDLSVHGPIIQDRIMEFVAEKNEELAGITGG
jgi:hypothetical protein